ncbi:ABC transporter ATP-binding protein [Candidatus Sumerlaeota bacterium]|nr:ABC transporter ATP-binding protein [Candidatus Sumerlaeota bacterium]
MNLNIMPAIELRQVTKIHPLRKARARRLKHLMVSMVRGKEKEEIVVAADAIDLEVPRNTTLGVIGVNGAGKTTLLRLISGITEPTSGEIRTRGTVLPLLELGAGFHPELSGYENVFLQGAMLGLKRSRIRALLGPIVEFAEIEDFIHMPVKHYSSGMYMRLAFSISVHVEPDILLVDEAFSVGDLYFQEKCMSRMREFRAAGGTILLVSHDMNLVEKTCDRVIWLDHGRVVAQGAPSEIAHDYEKDVFERSFPAPVPLVHTGQITGDRRGRYGTGAVTFDYMDLMGEDGRVRHTFENGRPMRIRLRYRSHRRVEKADLLLFVVSDRGHGSMSIATPAMGRRIDPAPGGGEIEFRIDRLDLAPGNYNLSIMCLDDRERTFETLYDAHRRVYDFCVAPRAGLSNMAGLEPPCRWEHRPGPRV